MKKHLLLFILFIFFCSMMYGQISIVESMDGGVPASWTSSGYSTTSVTPCEGTASVRDNLWSSSTTGSVTTSNQVGISNGTDIIVSYEWQTSEFSAGNGVGLSALVEYSTNAGTSYTTIGMYTASATTACTPFNFTIPGASVPSGSDFQLRITGNHVSGDFYHFIDNVSITQVSVNPPNCDAVLTSVTTGFPLDGNITWSAATGAPTGYTISVGSTMGGTDIANLVDVMTSTSYAPVGLAYGTTYYTTITPYNAIGNATGCTEQSFVTLDDPAAVVTVNCGSTSTENFCYNNNEDNTWQYTSSDGTSALKITFTAGQMESCCDDIIIYDGSDATGTILYQGNNSGDLTGLEVTSTGSSLFVVFDADGSVSCVQSSYTPADWGVTCLSCSPGGGSVSFGTCDSASGIMLDVDVTNIGDGTIIIKNDGGVADMSVTMTGVVSIGPFAFGTDVVVTLANPTDNTCDVVLPLVSTPGGCPPANDECSAAMTLTESTDAMCGNTLSGTTMFGTKSTETTLCSTFSNDDDVWYSFSPSQTGTYFFSVSNTSTTTYVNIYSGTCGGGLTSEGTSCFTANNSADLMMGQTYLVQVYSSSSTTDTDFDLCAYPAPLPPANDDCGGAFPLTVNSDLTCGSTTFGTISSATASGVDEAACGGTENDDVWFSFVATATTHPIELLNITGGTTDLYHSVWEGTCGALTLFAGSCSDPNTSTASGLTIGATYYLRVYSWTGTAGQTSAFDVCIGTNPPPPANDDSSGAVALSVDALSCTSGGVVSTTTSATDSGVSHSCASYQGGDVWFSAVVPSSGTITIETSNVSGSFSDAGMAAYEDAAGTTEISCDDDGNPGAFPSSAHSRVVVDDITLAGTTIFIAVWEYGNDDDGEFNICAWDPTPPPPPANDDCTDAMDILDTGTTGSGALTGQSLVGATPSGLPAQVCDSDGTVDPADVWYRITTISAGELIVNIVPGAASDVVMALYNSCGDPVASAEACADLNGVGVTESINVTAALKDTKGSSTTRADEFFLRVYEKTPSGQPFTVETQGSALPIELSSFEASAQRRGNLVKWSTLSEINSDYVEVQSSPNGSTKWESIGTVQTKGESFSRLDYDFFDDNPYSVTYYRLNAVDKDGREELSYAINVQREDKLGRMSLSPNPASTNISLQTVATTDMSGTIIIYDMAGQLMKNQIVNLKNGLNTISVDLDDLNTGIYLFSLQTEDGVQIEKIVKQ